MTDNSKHKENENGKEEIIIERDWFLQTLVNVANGVGSEFVGITLLTHGFLVSGQLVSAPIYFNGFAEELANSFKKSDSDDAKTIKESIIGLANKVYNNSDTNDSIPVVAYIHIKGAKFFHPNGSPIPSNQGVWWRGRLSEISGFSLGSLEIAK